MNVRGDDVVFHKEEAQSGGSPHWNVCRGTLQFRLPLSFADVIKANGVTVSNRVESLGSAVIYEAESAIFRNSLLVRRVLEDMAEEDSFVSR